MLAQAAPQPAHELAHGQKPALRRRSTDPQLGGGATPRRGQQQEIAEAPPQFGHRHPAAEAPRSKTPTRSTTPTRARTPTRAAQGPGKAEPPAQHRHVTPTRRADGEKVPAGPQGKPLGPASFRPETRHAPPPVAPPRLPSGATSDKSPGPASRKAAPLEAHTPRAPEGTLPPTARRQEATTPTAQPLARRIQSAPTPAKSAASEQTKQTTVHCNCGRVMQGKIVREIWSRVLFWHYRGSCDKCGEEIPQEDARYYCKECNHSLCMKCGAKQMNLCVSTNVQAPLGSMIPTDEAFTPRTTRTASGHDRLPSHIMPGDIFLCGPDKNGIHHVVLCCGPVRLSEEHREVLEATRSEQVFVCQTIESTHLEEGRTTCWYPCRSLFKRSLKTGETRLVGDVDNETGQVTLAETEYPVKVLLHPLRRGHGGPEFDASAYWSAIKISAETSKSWGIKTGLKATVLNTVKDRREGLNPDDYPDQESRHALMKSLRKRRVENPICSSVAIMVWQLYFELTSGTGKEGEDLAAQSILRWMPCVSNLTAPSAMVKILTKRGWVLRPDFDN
mmetsp:Transcript_56060/g.103743  ORF Transcript_56060/g.103743 Transcript_56060/m.103743 type:complete len:560 (-) Transcript_56060:79-1758(-)